VYFIVIVFRIKVLYNLPKNWLKQTTVQNSAAQNISDVRCIWFTDRSQFSFAKLKNTQHNRQYASDVTIDEALALHKNWLSQSLMVTDGVSKFGDVAFLFYIRRSGSRNR